MKTKILCAALLTVSVCQLTQAEINTKALTSAELKAMDCATLAVEKNTATRELADAEKNIANIQSDTPDKKVSKWAGIASSALGSLGGKSETASKAKSMTDNFTDKNSGADENNLKLQQALQSKAQSNLENIATFQKSKKCKIK